MADYTLLNLREVEDLAPRHGMGDIQARYARKALGLGNMGVSLFRLGPGYRLPFGHRHAEQEEVYLVLAGTARFKVEDELLDLGPYDALRVPGRVTRGMEAGPDGAEILAIGAPSTDNNDAEMVPDFWA